MPRRQIFVNEMMVGTKMRTVRHYDTQAHLGLGLQPDNMAHTVPKSRPQATLKHIGQMIFISTYHTTSPGSHPMNRFPNKGATAQVYCLSGARQCLKEYHCQANLLRWEAIPMPLLPLPPKHPLSNNNIGPPIPLTTRLIMTTHKL